MRLTIALAFLVALFVAEGEGLQCWTCKNVPSAECLSGGELVTCIGLQDSCQTTERKRDDSYLYWKECKQGEACRNNENNNPNDCHRGEIESTCRCCCYEDGCGRFDDVCGPAGGVTTGAQPSTPSSPPTEPPIPPKPEDCFCQEIEEWSWIQQGGEVECDASLPNGYWTAGDKCRYTCPNGHVIPEGEFAVRECRPAIEAPEVDTDLVYVWKPSAPSCVRDPTKCLDEPFVREDTPGGTVNYACPEELSTGGYLLGEQCVFFCEEEGYELKGTDVTICTRVEVGGELVNRFIPTNPCCDPPCDPNREADLLYVVDWSSSIKADEWKLMTQFLVDVTSELSTNPNLRFGVVVFGNGVQEDLNIPFEDFSPELLDAMIGIPFNGRIEGTHTINALEYVAENVYSNPGNFGQRPGVDNLVVFITDGVSTDSQLEDKTFDTTLVADAAAEMHAVTKTVYSVGVGLDRIRFEANRVRAEQELAIIAQMPSNVITITAFNELSNFLHNITEITCTFPCDPFIQLPIAQ